MTVRTAVCLLLVALSNASGVGLAASVAIPSDTVAVTAAVPDCIYVAPPLNRGSSVTPYSLAWGDLRVVPVQVFRVSDDDGGRRASVSPEDFENWVRFANNVFAPAGVAFIFSGAPLDFADLRSTLVNNMTGIGDPNWVQARSYANSVARMYPGKMLVFVRFGPGRGPTGGGFSWTDYDFIVLGGYGVVWHCGHASMEHFAHEAGHYLGLSHTFARTFPTVGAAESFFAANGPDPALFDGDGLGDTEPDPGIGAHECSPDQTVTLAGTVFALPRRNIMSYYNEADSLSPMQIQRLRWTLDFRAAHGMTAPVNNPAAPVLEVEALRVIQGSGCPHSVQDMSPWRPDRWSNGQQLFLGCADGGWLELEMPVRQGGRYAVDLYATLAPDFAKVSVSLDGRLIGSYDGYAPFVAPSGKIGLGLQTLPPGDHTLRLQASGRNRSSRGYSFGVDCLELNLIPAL